MKEDFLHYIWKYKLLSNDLKTSRGEELAIVSVGFHNFNAGPDFLEAKVIIKGVLWVGNIEIHKRTSDWFRHHHELDEAYDSIVLHVVYQKDKDLFRANGEEIPQLEMQGKFDPFIWEKYQYFLQNKNWIACEKNIGEIPRLQINAWIDRLLVERMEKRADEIKNRLSKTKNNWEQTFYETLARNFGFHVNAFGFEALAHTLPLNIIAKQKNNKFQLEALLYGQAGLLQTSFDDDYPRQLQNEYEFLKNKYKLIPLSKTMWRFARMRPTNFPGVRIAQFADLLHRSHHLFSKILDIENLNEIYSLFTVDVSDYWKTHYTFDKESIKRDKKLSKQSINLILINTIIPFLYYYGKERDKEQMLNRALKFLEQIPGEKNQIIKHWQNLGFSVQSSFNTQALIHLKKEYCTQKKCLTCALGVHLLKS